MALDERKRQKKLARKTAKRKKSLITAKKEHSTVINLMNDPMTVALASSAALVHECYVSDGLFENGLGQAVISKLLPNGRIAVAGFLLDVYCLGVKDAYAKAMSAQEFREYVKMLERIGPLRKVEPSYVRKLVESAETWAAGIGFSAHPDYRVAKQLFNDILAENCPDEFVFGRHGKPYFIQGPNETPVKVRQALETLKRTCGEGNFDYLLAAGVSAGDNF
ncbi:MAG: hypothetical protein U0Z53_11180 [Blastocatellia bacterium]